MWQGIIVEPGGEVNVIGNSSLMPAKIQNAIVAIKGEGNGASSGSPKIFVNLAEFDNNLTAIALEDDNYSSSMIQQSFFRCSSQMMNKAPYLGVYPEYHILLNEATSVVMGGGPSLNEFEDVFSGIRVNKSSLNIQKSLFKDLMDNSVSPSVKGIGIVASNTTATAQTIEVDSRFENLNRGLQVSGNFNVDVHDNFSTKYFRDIDDVAIFVNSMNYLRDISVVGINYFRNCNIGILLRGNNWNSVNISGNEFDNTDFKETRTGSFHNTAISIQSAIANPFNVLVTSNQITGHRIGIHAVNVDGIEVTNNGDNTALGIHMFNHDANFSPNEFYRGIWLQNCPHAFVAENVISNIVEVTSSTNAFRGIDIEESVRARINCNEVSGVPFGMYFLNYCNGTLLRANEFSLYKNAINLENASLPDQVQWNDQAQEMEPLDNLWNDAPVGGANPQTDRVTGTASPFNWYFRSPAIGNYNPLDAGMSSQFVNAQDDAAGYVNCYDISDRVSRDVRFGAIVGDSLEFESYEVENTWIARKYAYECMKLDTTILYQDSLTDGVYLAFYQMEDSLNTGKFSTIRVLSSDSSTFGNAESMNELVFDEIDLETNLKFTNQTYFDKKALGDTLNSSDTTALMAISDISYYSSGEAFYMSIGMLGLEKSPNVPALRIGQEGMPIAIEALSKTKPAVLIYPNPATNSFTVQSSNWMLQKVEVYDSQLRLVQEGRISDSHHNFPVLFKPGIYGVKVIGVNNEIRWLKLIII